MWLLSVLAVSDVSYQISYIYTKLNTFESSWVFELKSQGDSRNFSSIWRKKNVRCLCAIYIIFNIIIVLKIKVINSGLIWIISFRKVIWDGRMLLRNTNPDIKDLYRSVQLLFLLLKGNNVSNSVFLLLMVIRKITVHYFW